MDAVSFLEIVLKQLIEEDRRTESVDETDDLDNSYAIGYNLALSKLLNIVKACSLLDDLPNNMREYINKILIEFPEISKQQ